MGIPFQPYGEQVSQPPAYNPRMLRRQAVGSGPGFVDNMIRVLQERGAEIMMGTEMTGLLMEGARVAGVRAVQGGQEINITARNVVLATGGFSASAHLWQEWTSETDRSLGLRHATIGPVSPSNTGDGILIAMRDAGADIYRHPDGTPSVWAVISGLANPFVIAQPAGGVSLANTRANVPLPRPGTDVNFGLQDQIIVNREGHRFVNEAQPYGSGEFNNVFNAIAREEGPSWIIYSGSTTTPAMRVTLDAAVAAYPSMAFSADSIAELAAAIGAPGLSATVAAYNAASVDAFGKDMNRRVPMTAGPFYAVQVIPNNIIGSIGGLVTDDYGRVLNGQIGSGQPIPNLFAVGEISNRPFFGQGYVGGSCLSIIAVIAQRAGAFIAQQ